VKQPKEAKKTCSGIRGRIQGSMKKLQMSALLIKGKHLYDAIGLLQSSATNASEGMLKAVLQVISKQMLKLDDNCVGQESCEVQTIR